MPRLFYCDHYPIPLPPGHKFPTLKYPKLREALTIDGFYSFAPAPLISTEALARIHDPGYIARFLDGTLDPSVIRRIGFPWSREMVERTLASVGGTVQAAEQAASTGFGGVLAGGTHHAFRAEGAGFCIFNDIAVAIEHLRERGEIERAAVLDVDVHQGDGTAKIFEDDPNVLTISLHGATNFPFRKQRSKIDVPLPDQTGDADYLAALRSVLPALVDFRPDILFYQSGVDGLAEDRLGKLSLTFDGLRARDRLAMETAGQADLPFVITLGGGYSDPIDATVHAHANTFRTAAEVFWRAPVATMGG